VNIMDTCERCDGKGNEPGTKVQHCHYCGGSGMVRMDALGPCPTSPGTDLLLPTCLCCSPTLSFLFQEILYLDSPGAWAGSPSTGPGCSPTTYMCEDDLPLSSKCYCPTLALLGSGG
jgi:hypothetical protein